MTKPSDKWLQKARALRSNLYLHSMANLSETDDDIARALEAVDKAATERAVAFAVAQLVAEGHEPLAYYVAAAIRKGTK